MPLYFAYGSNMDADALRRHAPKARALGLARLARHRFALMPGGFASVRRDPASDVHGVLFDLALSDVRPLDRYESLDRGLYTKVCQPVIRYRGAAVRAIVYVGGGQGTAPATPGYMDAIVATARRLALPADYVTRLEALRQGPAALTPRRRSLRPEA